MRLKDIILDAGLNYVIYAEKEKGRIPENKPLYLKSDPNNSIGTLAQLKKIEINSGGDFGVRSYPSKTPLGTVYELKHSLQIDDEASDIFGGKRKSRRNRKSKKSRKNRRTSNRRR